MSSPLPNNTSEELTKSKKRIADHGEVFTPRWLVDEMIDLVKEESFRIDSRFLEPACGSGNFLCEVLVRKLQSVKNRYSKSDFEKRHYGIFALMCIYGIELLEDNVKECRDNLLEIFLEELKLQDDLIWRSAAQKVLEANIIQGDALTLQTLEEEPIIFAEWGYLGSGTFQRRDFRFDNLTQRAGIKGTLFELFEEEDLFIPVKTYNPMSVVEVAN